MSFIQKLENSYVTILRVVILIIATILLLGAVGLGAMAIYEKFKSPASAADIKVDSADVVNAVAPGEAAAPKKASAVTAKTHKAEFEKAYALVAPFVKKYSHGKEKVDKRVLFSVLEEGIGQAETPELQQAYLAGWIETMGKSVKDERVIARVKSIGTPAPAQKPATPSLEEAAMTAEEAAQAAAEAADGAQAAAEGDAAASAAADMAGEDMAEDGESPTVLGVVYEISNAYTELFSTRQREQQEKEMERAVSGKSTSFLFMAAAASIFFGFLSIMFLTIAIRIERNLRDIAARPLAI